MPPKTLTDLAGLRVSAEDLLSAVSATAAQPIWVVDPDDVIGIRQPRRDHGARLRHGGRPARAPPPRDHPPQAPGRYALSGRGVPDAAAANRGPDGRSRFGLVLPARRLEVSRLVCVGADRDGRRPRRGRALRRHRGPLTRRAGAARARCGAGIAGELGTADCGARGGHRRPASRRGVALCARREDGDRTRSVGRRPGSVPATARGWCSSSTARTWR